MMNTMMNTVPLARRHWLARAGLLTLAAIGAPFTAAQAQDFDHDHAAWTTLLKKHVKLISAGNASQLSYAGMARDRGALKLYLAQLASVSPQAFAAFSKAQQMAFLINAYNAYTVELILTRYPKLASIKDLGSILSNPWRQPVAPLLGKTMTLDEIEHDTLRARGRYDDPRIHFAVNCASIGCPMLREEAFVAERLEPQLESQERRFMSDRTRNRWNASEGKLEVSKIFDWYGEDFRLGYKGIASLNAFLARFADRLAEAPADRERIRSGKFDVDFLDYDWKLNDTK